MTQERPPRASRQRYRDFVRKYRTGELGDGEEEEKSKSPGARDAAPKPGGEVAESEGKPKGILAALRQGKRREYLTEYLRWLKPHRVQITGVFLLALVVA